MIVPPPPGSPNWMPSADWQQDLLYLGWGHRAYHGRPLPGHLKPGWSICYIRSGMVTLTLPGRGERMRAGQMLFAGPDCPFGWTHESDLRCELLTWIWAAPFSGGARICGADTFRVLNVPRAEIREVESLHARCRRELASPRADIGRVLGSVKDLLEISLLRCLEPDGAANENAMRLSWALEWMRRHPHLHHPVEPLADYLQISPSGLHRLFREETGQSPGAVHRDLRLREAERLIRGEGLLVKEAALRLGYRHANDLSRALARMRKQNAGAFSPRS